MTLESLLILVRDLQKRVEALEDSLSAATLRDQFARARAHKEK